MSFWKLLGMAAMVGIGGLAAAVVTTVIYEEIKGRIDKKRAEEALRRQEQEIARKLEQGDYNTVNIGLTVTGIKEEDEYTCVEFTVKGTDLKYGLKSKDGTDLEKGDYIQLVA